MRDIGSHAPRLKAMGRPKALGSRRSGRAGEPAVGDSMGASESLADVPHRPRLPSSPPNGPTDRRHDLYGSFSALLGISTNGNSPPSPPSRLVSRIRLLGKFRRTGGTRPSLRPQRRDQIRTRPRRLASTDPGAISRRRSRPRSRAVGRPRPAPGRSRSASRGTASACPICPRPRPSPI